MLASEHIFPITQRLPEMSNKQKYKCKNDIAIIRKRNFISWTILVEAKRVRY